LQALRSQLNPHFLFNALHSIAELVHENPTLAEN
jgi:LytS/YehU family sensor histidine kinase